MTALRSYDASHIKTRRRKNRRRASNAEMEERAEFLIDYAEEHGPITVRGLYYQAEVAGLPGIDKSQSSYAKVQRQVLSLRREGRLGYQHIADMTRWMRKPTTHNSLEDAIADAVSCYRRSLWRDAETYVEVWCEKDALAGVILPVTAKYDVPLMVARGYCSETFAYGAVAARRGDFRPYYVYYLGDFDRSGQDAARSLEEKLTRFADEEGIEVVFQTIAITERQVRGYDLPTRPPKRNTSADEAWPHDFACELDAMAPDDLRGLVEDAINAHLDQDQLRIMEVAEASERELGGGIVKMARRQMQRARAAK